MGRRASGIAARGVTSPSWLADSRLLALQSGDAASEDHLRRKKCSGGGPTGILIYCADYRCSHSIAMSADYWSDAVRLSDIEPWFVCSACGKRGADVRPNFSPARMGTTN